MTTQLKILMTAAAVLVSMTSAPVFAQAARHATSAPQNATYDNSGWNGYNNGGDNNTWFDGKTYRSDRMPLGEDIASDAASVK
jgi:uncharacterized membrane protein YedE/YeeE